MKQPDGHTQSSWYTKLKVPAFRPLTESVEADVCVVGAGIAGLTAAYLLAREGLSVIVLDEGPIGSGQTGRTSAHLASALDDRFTEIERLHGKQACRLAYQSHAAGIDLIEQIAEREQIDCDFARIDGRLSAGPDDPPDSLDEELAAARRAGVEDVEMLPRGGIGDARCIRFGRQARFQPMQYLVGLADALQRLGGKIHTGHRVVDVQGSDPKKTTPATAKQANDAVVSAAHVVVATNTPAPINDWFGIYTKQASYRTYMIAANVPRGAVADALYWDTLDPYHYVRLQRQGSREPDLLLIGGEDHKTGQAPADHAPFEALEQWGRQMFPAMGQVRYQWSGQVQEPADGLAFIGKALTKKQEVFVITGDSGMGLTHSSMGAQLVDDLIQGRANAFEALYDPSRKTLNREFVKENTNTLGRYRELLTPGDLASTRRIARGEGAVMRDGLKKIAVYRDDAGKLHRCSAVCTHLQCIVHWNSIEKSWDCPCHGSRFDPKGKVLIGPAVDDLPPV